MNYRCVEIPEPDFDASFTDEMVVTAYQNEEDFNPQMPDEYPNVRLSQLEQEIQETTEKAAEAFETANNAAELAELARTAASAAITEIAEHETEIENPHPVTTTQEFADTQITPLATEATYTPAVWAYLVGLFTTVPKSVLQHVVKGWTVLQNLAERISVLENKTLFEITLEEDTIQIDIVGLSIKEGESFKLLIKGDSGYESTSLYVRVNDIISPNYQYSSSIYYYLLIPVGNERFSNDLTMALHGGRLVGSVIYSRSASGTTAGAVVALSTFDIHIDEITKISITRNTSTIIKAGTYIKLLKL